MTQNKTITYIINQQQKCKSKYFNLVVDAASGSASPAASSKHPADWQFRINWLVLDSLEWGVQISHSFFVLLKKWHSLNLTCISILLFQNTVVALCNIYKKLLYNKVLLNFICQWYNDVYHLKPKSWALYHKHYISVLTIFLPSYSSLVCHSFYEVFMPTWQHFSSWRESETLD